MIIKLNNIFTTSMALGLMFFTNLAYALDCTSSPVNPANSSQLKIALQQATNAGKPLIITGTFYISSDIQVFLKKDLVVDATGAKFIATTNLDGDMFSFDTHSTKSKECSSENIKADFKWKGGDFDMSRAKVSTVVPYTSRTPIGMEGVKSTADALSIRGVHNSTNYHKVDELVIENITFTGTKNDSDPFYLAGGDSGILMIGASKATIKNNKFYGVRDAAIYLSAAGDSGQFGDHFTISNNYIERAYDGATSKRGADNIKMINNTLVDVAVGLSVKRVYDGWTATNVLFEGNSIDKSMRAIHAERANNVTVENNVISNLGASVANETSNKSTFNKYSDAFEGVSLNGVQGVNLIKNNTISGVSGVGTREADTTTWGIVTRFEDGRDTTGVINQDNNFSKLDKWTKRL